MPKHTLTSLLAGLLALTLCACTPEPKRSVFPPRPGPGPTSGQPVSPRPPAPASTPTAAGQTQQGSLAAQADQAYRARDWRRAVELYGRVLEDKGLPANARERFLSRFAHASLESGDAFQAAASYEELAAQFPNAQNEPEFHSRFVAALDGANRRVTADDHLRRVAADPARPWQLKQAVAGQLSKRLIARRGFAAWLNAMAEVAAQAPSPADKAALEAATLPDLAPLSDANLEQMANLADERRPYGFPSSLVTLERAARLLDRGAPERAGPEFEALAASGELADPELITRRTSGAAGAQAGRTSPPPDAQGDSGRIPVVSDPAPTASVSGDFQDEPALPTPTGEAAVALILPLTGRASGLGREVQRGAQAAVALLEQKGARVRLEVLDSEDIGLTERLIGLGPEFSMVGGPMRSDLLTSLQEQRALTGRATFAFIPATGDSREGLDAWRMLASPEDQARALVNFAVGEMGLTRLGVLAPGDAYGRRLRDAFVREATARGATVVEEGYGPDKARWSRNAQNLVTAGTNAGGLQAVFLPDSYANSKVLITHLGYHQETADTPSGQTSKLLFLGPELWSQTLGAGGGGADDIDYANLQHAVFPTAWRPGGKASDLNRVLTEQGGRTADVWTMLGYDFVRFAATLRLAPGGRPETVNPRLARTASRFDWTLAPIAFDEAGRMTQKMTLVTAIRGGLAPIRAEDMKSRLQPGQPAN